MLPLHQENQEVVLFDDEMNQEVILSIIFAGISIWRAGETENHRHELHISYQIKNKDRNTQTPDTTLILVYMLTHNNLRKKLLNVTTYISVVSCQKQDKPSIRSVMLQNSSIYN
jgi:hypothetical protein